MKILVLGASGMLGNAMVRVLNENSALEVFGTVRSGGAGRFFTPDIAERLIAGIDVEQHDALVKLFARIRPDVVVNCIGLVKQLADAEDPLVALPLNAMLPHRLARLCELAGARLVHMSTDCVFSGKKGGYRESDSPDAEDVYGRSKLLGEVAYPHAITLRTSIIGHELQSAHGLVGWFLSQEKQCKGYTKAIFSGFPTVVLAQIVRDVILPRASLSGVYHVAAQPISKYDLLKLIADVYGKTIEIVPDDKLAIDRSLNADLFKEATGYVAPEWRELIKLMHTYR
ncbi:MAG TPA: NAD(P)-dependent oxidoreductase [Gallionellaceae bacterium]|nr:NAD(P)-dependent oxidoreductase [Gallionellaceae bacterium]